MPCLQKLLLLAGLMLFAPATYAIATPEQAAGGKVRGFTGTADVEVTGDYLTSTFCYCEYPPKVEEFTGLAHYYQIEYYNFHLNTTFILTSNCPQDNIVNGINCVPSGKNHVLAGDTMEYKTCRTWPGYLAVQDFRREHDDRLCYKPRRHHGDDFIYFNKQKRNLGQDGGQGPVWQDKMESEKVCEGMCRNMDAVLLKDENYTPSHQVMWTEM
ncbi:MAG: hypothetical protein Q9175_006809, partial [Cornicularia normoerica]